MRSLRKASPMLARASASQAQYNPVKKLPEVDQQHHQPQQGQQQQQPLLQTLPTPQKYRVSPMDLMRPVKTKAETVLLYTEWANHYLQKAGYECFITDLQNDLRDGKMLVNLTHAVVNEHVILKDSNKSSRDIIVACLKVLEDIGVEVHDVSVDGILSGRLKCILGLFFNLSKFKQKLRERQSQPNQIVHSEIPQKSGDSPLNSTGLDSPGSDRRYVTPPSSVQSHVQHHSRPLSDPQALKKPIDAKSRLPVFRQNRTKNCLSDSPQPKSGEVAASSLPTRSIRLPQPIKNQKNLPSKAPTSSLGSPGTNPPMLPMSRPGGVLVKHPSSLPQPASIQMRSLVDIGGSRPLREISAENSPQQPISKSTGTNNAITPPLFTKSHMQHYPPSNYPGVSQLPTPTLSFNAGILRFKRPSDFLPQSLTPTPSSKSSSTASLSLTSNGGHNLSNSSKTRHDEHVNVNGVKDDEEGEGEGSPLGSREINRAVSQLEDVNPGTWSGRLSPTLPGMSTSNGHFYLTTARQRASLDTHLHNKQTSTSANHNDGDDKSIKSECLPGKDLNRPMKSLGIPPTLFSSESNLFTPDAWSNSLPNRPFHRAMKATTRKSPSTLVQLRARADGREEVPTERIYGPLGFLKLPYDPPRSHTDLGEVKSPYSVLGCTDMKHSAEICHLRRELETARLKVTTLTSQLELNACLVANFEQSLANMTQRLQSLTVSAAEKDSELRELRQIIDSMVQERSFSGAVDLSSGKPFFPPSSSTNTNANAPVAAADVVDLEEEKSNSCPPGTPKSSGIKKGGWLRSSIDRAFRRRGSQSSLTGDTGSYNSHSKFAQPVAAGAWNSPDHQTSPSLRKKFVRAASVSADVDRTRGYPGSHLSNSSCVGADGSRIVPTSPTSKCTSACCEAHSRCRLLEAEVETLRKELGERERRLTDAQLQALASAHQVDQLRDQLNLLFQQLSLLRSDNERLHASAAAANTPQFSTE